MKRMRVPGLLLGMMDGGASVLERRVMALLERRVPWTLRRRVFSSGVCVAVMAALSCGVAMVGVRTVVFAQEATLLHADGPLPRFEVATIKPAPDDGRQMTDLQGAVIAMHSFSVKDLLETAYGIKSDSQLEGVQGWMTTKRFDIDAKMGAEELAAEQKMTMQEKVQRWSLMTQALLAERFGLKVSETSREVPVYELEVAKGGSKLKPGVMEAKPTRSPLQGGPGKIVAVGVPMATLTGVLGRQQELGGGGFLSGGGMVVDKTGLTGVYDWTLTWQPMNAQPGAAVNPDAPGLFTAIEEQLGLKVVASKAPVQVLVVEHVEPPTGN